MNLCKDCIHCKHSSELTGSGIMQPPTSDEYHCVWPRYEDPVLGVGLRSTGSPKCINVRGEFVYWERPDDPRESAKKIYSDCPGWTEKTAG